jgi:redox-sensitive bicupin YhaK (pirin superfamily)
MPNKVLLYENQNKTLLANGVIEENKPVGLSHDNKTIKPYSNIFNWSRIWTDIGGEIKEHPHKGFEILTYVIKGSVEHFNPNTNKWIKITSGDLEVLQSNSGINQAVKVAKNSEVIQIWLDPDVRKSLAKEYEWIVFDSDDFYQAELPGKTIKRLIDEDSPAQIEAEKVIIADYKFTPGSYYFKFSGEKYYSFYILKGEIELDGKFVGENSFVIVKDEENFELAVSLHTRLILVESPLKPSYKTYSQLKSEST